MPSAKYIGYLGGAAVAAGVGAAIAVAGQGTALADADSSSSSSSASDPGPAKSETATKETVKAVDTDTTTDTTEDIEKDTAKDTDDSDTKGDVGPEKTDKPTFDPAEAVKELTKKFGINRPSKTDESEDATQEGAEDEGTAVEEEPTEVEEETGAEAPAPVFNPVSDLADKAAQVAASLTKPVTAAADVTAAPDTDTHADTEAGPVPWSINPFRPMPPEPAPNDMPGALWQLEQQILNAFAPVPFLQPFVREGYEAAFRGSQMIPFVNAVIPAINIIGQLPNLASGDPVVFRTATQSIINNLIVTFHPVSVLYYGYDEIADFINLEYEAQQLKQAFYTTAWDLLDPFAILHNRGESGLPLSPSSPGQTVTAPSTAAVQLAAAVGSAAAADAPGSDPFRADDPNPIGMPVVLLQTRDLVMLLLPSPVKEVFREGFELAYRASQVVPVVNMVIPVANVLPAVIQALTGDKAGAQIAINQLLLTAGPVPFLYYGYDQIADLLNTEEASFAAKEQFYVTLWDSLDAKFILHNQGESGLIRL